MIILAVLAGGMIGAPARYLTDRFVQVRHDTVLPWGTYSVNMAGSAVLGFLLGAERHLGLPPVLFALLGTGFCGGLTTFSTFGYETMRLLEDGAVGSAGLNVIGSLAVGVLLAWLGFELAGALLVTIPARSPQSAWPDAARTVDCRGSRAQQSGTADSRRPDCQVSQHVRSWRLADPAARTRGFRLDPPR